MGRIVVWIITLVGLAPCVYVAIAGLMWKRFLFLIAAPRRYYDEERSIYIHDSHISLLLGPWEIELNPHYWSIALLLGGVAMIIVALVAILRPYSA